MPYQGKMTVHSPHHMHSRSRHSSTRYMYILSCWACTSLLWTLKSSLATWKAFIYIILLHANHFLPFFLFPASYWHDNVIVFLCETQCLQSSSNISTCMHACWWYYVLCISLLCPILAGQLCIRLCRFLTAFTQCNTSSTHIVSLSKNIMFVFVDTFFESDKLYTLIIRPLKSYEKTM